MFSSYNQPLNNLLASERFYYNNYEYYNDYEKIQQKYKDDLSKVFFRLNRKTKGTIFYQWDLDLKRSEQNEEMSETRSGTMMDLEDKEDTMSEKNRKNLVNRKDSNVRRELGIQKLLASVLQTFHELNYSDIRLDQESKKELYEFVHLKYINEISQHTKHQMDQQTVAYEENSIEVLNDILKKQAEEEPLYIEAIQKMNSFAKEEDQMFLERWNAFQNFGFYYLNHELVKKQHATNFKEELKRLYRFATRVRFIIERTLASNYMNSLFFNLPNIKKSNRIFHPLTLALSYTNNFFEEKNGFRQKPRIVFLNLDGRQTPYNLRYARNIGSNLLYISVYKEPTHHYKKNQKMEYEFESDYDTSFANISQCYSRLLINEAFPQAELFHSSQDKFTNKSKMMIFPLNSEYLRRQFYKTESSKCKNNTSHHKSFPTLQTSNDIYFLFQTIIFEQIRSFNPTFIFVSHNGFLNINENHWNQIVKNLTIIADHKVSLFINFIDRLGKHKKAEDQESQEEHEEQPEEQEQEEDDDLDQFKVRNIQVVKEFINKYIPFKFYWPYIQHERVLNSMLMFLKISSGVYSMQTRLLLSNHLKYSLGHRYSYLQGLCQSKQISSSMVKFLPKMIQSEQLKELYNNQCKIQLKQNRKQNESYEKLIDSVILQFLNEQNRKQIFSNNHRILYRLQQVLEEQQHQNILRYGTEEDQNPEYSATISNSVQAQNRQQTIIHDYLKEMKRKLLLENLETYRHRKVFYQEEESDTPHQSSSSGQKVKCFKFYLYEDDSEEISFQKYSQVIFDPKKSRVYIVNYKSTDQRHLILYGSMTPTAYDKKFSIKVQIARQSQRELQTPIYSYFERDSYENNLQSNEESMTMTSEQQNSILKKDLVFINYSHCFVKNKLYLFWPQKWSIRDQIRHKLLGIKYKPDNVNLIVKVQYNNDHQCVYETLQLKENEKVYVQPRIGCSTYEIPSQEDQFFIFGGIQDNENDFFDIGQGMYHMHVKDNLGCFVVKPLPKIKQKNMKQSIPMMSLMRKSLSFATRLRPKMYYRVQKCIENGSNSQQSRLIISGGLGRQFTNFFNAFSYESYLFNTNSKLIDIKQVHQRRLIKLPKSIQVNRVGKFFMISNNQNIQEVQQNFSDLPKDVFAYEYRTQKNMFMGPGSSANRQNRELMNIESSSSLINSSNIIVKHCQNREVNSFIDERYRTSDFKFDGKKIYLCGFNRTIREKIYTKFWSPEFYILDGNQSNIVHISLKTEKNYSYNISNFLMPRQEDIVSLCLDEDRLYVLSSSPVIHSIEFSSCKYVLYEGNLSSINDIINKHELQMHEKYEFKKQKEHMLKYKTLYAFDQKIYLFGGLASIQDPSILTLTNEQSMDIEGKVSNKISYREDYIIQKEKNKLVLKTRKVQSSKDSVEMISPAIVKFNELLYFYSIQMTETIIKKQSPFPEIQQNYKLKIQQFSSESSGQGRCVSQTMKFYAWNGNENRIVRIIPRLNEPKFVSILKHEPFNLSKFKQHLQKAVIRLNKRIQQSTLQDERLSNLYAKCLYLMRQKNQENLIGILQRQDKFFGQVINAIKPEVTDRERNLEEEELIKDLKICYSLVNKLILQSLIEKIRIQESNLQQTISNQESLMQSANYENLTNASSQNLKREKLVQKLQRLTLNAEEIPAQFRFIVEDSKSSRKIRYIAIGPLANVEQLRFFRIRFKHDVSLCLNKTNQDEFYYHPTVNSCEQIDLNDKFAQYDIMSEEDIKKDARSYKEYKLYCQLKI